jgi:hypothetical protein
MYLLIILQPTIKSSLQWLFLVIMFPRKKSEPNCLYGRFLFSNRMLRASSSKTWVKLIQRPVAWLMRSSKLQSCLELCRFVQVFLKSVLQNRKCMPFGLARVFHSWLSSEYDGVLLDIHNCDEESCVWGLVATTSLNLTVISLPQCQTSLDTSIAMFITIPFVAT